MYIFKYWEVEGSPIQRLLFWINALSEGFITISYLPSLQYTVYSEQLRIILSIKDFTSVEEIIQGYLANKKICRESIVLKHPFWSFKMKNHVMVLQY